MNYKVAMNGFGRIGRLFFRASLNQDGFISMYRWHLPDPIYWKQECRITIQQISWDNGLAERQDDWSTATFWYEPIPSAPLPELSDISGRIANIWTEKE